jgi:hypothetical protein
MGLEPDRVPHIREASHFLGNSSVTLFDQAGEALQPSKIPFQVVPEFRHLADLSLARSTPEQPKLTSGEPSNFTTSNQPTNRHHEFVKATPLHKTQFLLRHRHENPASG